MIPRADVYQVDGVLTVRLVLRRDPPTPCRLSVQSAGEGRREGQDGGQPGDSARQFRGPTLSGIRC
jgi:hypothetical protein